MGGMSIIAKRLKQARERVGDLSQARLGTRAGIVSGASTRMSQYENGKHSPNLLTLTRIGAALDIPAPYFYCEDDVLAELILKFGTLDEAQKKRLLAFADKL
jgi:transcriptional regulator with XRE-family HTH domain